MKGKLKKEALIHEIRLKSRVFIVEGEKNEKFHWQKGRSYRARLRLFYGPGDRGLECWLQHSEEGLLY
jgi:hypothetical protein